MGIPGVFQGFQVVSQELSKMFQSVSWGFQGRSRAIVESSGGLQGRSRECRGVSGAF